MKDEGVGGALGLNTLCIGRLKSNINIGSKLELITPYHIKFVVKLCEKYCKGRITHIFVKLKLL